MMRLQGLACAALAVWAFGCGPDHRGDDTAGAHIVIDPPDANITVNDNVPVAQAYTATLIDDNGDSHDITANVSFTVANPSYGNWTGPTLSVTGGGAGITQVLATNGTLMASAKLTVHVNGSRDDGSVPPGTGGMFDGATECRAHRLDRLDDRRRIDAGLRLRLLSNAAPAQDVNAAVVRDAEQPGLERPRVVERVELSIGVEQGFLHDVLAFGHRSHHPRAVSVQARAQRADSLEEREVP